MARSRQQLGDILVGWGLMTPAQVEQANKLASGSGKRIGDVIVEQGFAKEDQVAKGLAKLFGYEYVDLAANGVGKQIDIKLLPEDLVKKHSILPLEKANGRLKLIIHDPGDLELLDMLRFRLNVEIEPRIAPRSQIKKFIEGAMGGGAAGAAMPKMVDPGQSLVTESIDKSVDKSVDKSLDKSIDVVSEDGPIVRRVSRLLPDAD